MGKIKLIVVLILMIFAFPQKAYGEYREAGSSAKVVASSQKSEEVQKIANINLKRKVIVEVLSKYGSPLLPEANAFVDACSKYNIDCYLLPSIAGLESTFGKFYLQGTYNPFGWGGGNIVFLSWADGFNTVASGLKNNYIAQGADTIESIGPIYAASPTWATRVRYFHNEFMRVEAEKQLYFEKVTVE